MKSIDVSIDNDCDGTDHCCDCGDDDRGVRRLKTEHNNYQNLYGLLHLSEKKKRQAYQRTSKNRKRKVLSNRLECLFCLAVAILVLFSFV